MPIIRLLDKAFQRITLVCGILACAAMILLLLNVFYDVIMRYAFNNVSIGMQELEWHLFSVIFLLGIPYTLQRNGHVRVDIFYESWTDRSKAWINLIGAAFFVLPFTLLATYYGIDFAQDAFRMGEGSGDPGGLPHRWVVKSLIPISLFLTALAGLGMVTQALRVLIGHEPYPVAAREHLS